MKKLILGTTVLAIILFASSSMAAGLKVPSSLCFSLNGYADKHQLTFKALGNLPASNGKVKMYSINGFVNGGVITQYMGLDSFIPAQRHCMPRIVVRD